MVFLPQIDCIFIGFSLFNRFQYLIFRSNNLFQSISKGLNSQFSTKKKKIRQRNYGKSFEIDFFPFWNWIGAIILFIFHEMHNSHTYQIHINQLVEIQILNIQYICRKIRQRNLIKLQFLIWIQNLKKMCAMCLPGVCRLCISFVKSVFLNEIGKKPYWHSHTIGRYRLESKP